MVDEAARLASVACYCSTVQPQDPALVVLTRAITTMLQMPMAWISLVGDMRQLVLAATGVEAGSAEPSYGLSFCIEAIRQAECPLLVADARLDARFSTGP